MILSSIRRLKLRLAWAGASLCAVAAVILSGCAVPAASQQAPSRFTVGFWFWHWQTDASDAASMGEPLDALFLHAGTIEQGRAYSQWPAHFPPAKEYWIVYRYEKQGVPDVQVVSALIQDIVERQADARRRQLKLAGVQLDIDSPTGRLSEYAGFLREVRRELPAGMELSITALLDWFRSGSAIGEVIAQVDEFVPQFYDVENRDEYSGGTAIAARVDGARWGPIFNRFNKRFRVGISTFGRAKAVPRAAPATGASRYVRAVFYGDLAPIDIATNPAFQLQTSRNAANELVLSYRATRKVRVGYGDFEAGDMFQFILASPESVRIAVQGARQMGGHIAGVVFFRWAGSDEMLSMQPDEALTAAGLSPPGRPKGDRVDVIDGGCAEVDCVDVYLESARPFAAAPLHYRIHSSTELEYFLPEKNVPVHMTGPSQLEVSLPPYCARGRLYMGRAVTAKPSEYTVEEGR